MSINEETYLAKITDQLKRIADSLEDINGKPPANNCSEYALGHTDGVAWCRKALDKAIQERGREFAIDFLHEYLEVKP